MVFGFGKKSGTSTPQDAPEALFPKLTAAQVRQALSTAPRAECFSAGFDWDQTAPSLLFAAQQFDGVWACCCGHVNGLVVHDGFFPFKVLKCTKCKHVVCRFCKNTTSDTLKPCIFDDVCADLKKRNKKVENIQLVKVCSGCGLSHRTFKYKGQPFFRPKCYCSTDLSYSSICFRLGRADDYRRDPAGAEDLAKQKWADAMVLRDHARACDKNRRERQAENQVVGDLGRRREKGKMRNQVDRPDGQNLQQEPRPVIAPTTRVPRQLRVHTVHEDYAPQYAQTQPKATNSEQHDPQQVEWSPLVGELMAPTFQLHLSVGHGNRYGNQDSSLLAQPSQNNYWPPLSPAMRTAPLPSDSPQGLRIGISVSAHGRSLRPDTARSATWDSRDMQSTFQPRPELSRRVETEYTSGIEHERLNEGAHDFLKSTLGTVKYESLNGREKSEMIEAVRVVLREDFQSLKLRDRE